MSCDVPLKHGLPLAALCLLCACGGNYSNVDLEFMNALPVREELASKLPEDGTTRSGLEGAEQRRFGLALGEVADFYQGTRDASAVFNGGLDFLLGIIETARAHPPTSRTDTTRTWGPFPVREQPGFLAKIVMERVSEERFTYRIEFRRSEAGAPWFTIMEGSFLTSGGIRKGDGELQLFAQRARDRGLTTRGLDELDTLSARYSTRVPPVRVDMAFTFVPGASLQDLSYRYREQPDGQGAMRFVFRQTRQTFQLTSRWLPDGRGIGEGTITQGDFMGATQVECWDEAFLLRYLSRSWEAPQGDPGACPQVQPWTE